MVGDGNLTFSLSLARHLIGVKMIASTYLTRGELDEAYGPDHISKTVEALTSTPGVQVLHGIDAT